MSELNSVIPPDTNDVAGLRDFILYTAAEDTFVAIDQEADNSNNEKASNQNSMVSASFRNWDYTCNYYAARAAQPEDGLVGQAVIGYKDSSHEQFTITEEDIHYYKVIPRQGLEIFRVLTDGEAKFFLEKLRGLTQAAIKLSVTDA
jgi:hypothetical protein